MSHFPLLIQAILLWIPSVQAQTPLESSGVSTSSPTSLAISTPAFSYGIPLTLEKGPWVIGEVRFTGHKQVSEYALINRVRAKRGTLYTPFDIRNDVDQIKSLPNILSVEPALYAMPDQAAPANYLPIVVSTMLARIVYTVQEKEILLPGLQAPATAQAATPARALEAPVSVSGVVLTPTAYRGLGQHNRPGLGLDINAVYYIGRIYGKNNLDFTTRKTNFIDRLGIWLLTLDGKMQLQSETTFRPALAAGVQGIFHFRDAQPALQTPTATVKLKEKSTRLFSDAYIVVSKNLRGLRTSLGFMQGNAGDQVGLLSEFFTSQALLFNGHPNQTASSKSVFFGSLMLLPKPQYPLAVEFFKPNGMPLSPILLNFKLGYFFKLNFDLAYLKFQGGWDILGMFQFRYTHFPKK